MQKRLVVFVLALSICGLCSAARKPLKNPDLTKGEKPNSEKSYAMGPTGFQGWMFHNGRDSSESRQILVTEVDAKSPADGKVEKGDVILGANGNGADADPPRFKDDARKALATSIQEAEGRNPATLKLLVWRPNGKVQPVPGSSITHIGGQVRTVILTLETLGVYSDTAPYNCEKSKTILAKGLRRFYEKGQGGFSGLGALVFMGANNPNNPDNAKYQAKAKEWVYTQIPTDERMAAMLGDFSKLHSSKPAWSHSYSLILLCEYYLQTKDEKVLPAIEAHAVCYAKGQSWIGTTGHGYALKNPDGGFNGPMAGYGAINGTGVAGFLGMVLARECGIKNPEVAVAIERADLFYSHFAFRGGIGYGEYGPSLGKIMYDMNGKHGTTALALSLQPKRVKEGKYFARLTACSSYERAYGHAGPLFNYVWPPLGAAAGGDELASHYFKRVEWDLDLSRDWQGGYVFAPLNRGVGKGGRFAPEISNLLTYTLPLRQLYITGKGHDKTRWLTEDELKETVVAEDFDPKPLSDEELLAALESWSPNIRARSVDELAGRESFKTLLPKLYDIAKDKGRSRISRAHACVLIAKTKDKTSADILVSLLQDKDSWVRYAAAFSLRTMPTPIKKTYVNELLRAAIAMGRPTFPLDPDDPLQQAQGEVSMLLFYDGSAYGPRGVIHNGIDGVDRELLLPAIRAVAQTASGLRRTILRSVYPRLSYEEVLELAPTIVESIRVQAPADAMFSAGIMKAGAETLQKHRIADGVPLLRACDYRISRSTPDILRGYAGSLLTVEPDPEALDWLYEKLYVKGDQKAQKALEAVLADTSPKKLKTLKVIKAVTAEPSILSLPTLSTALKVDAVNYARPDEKDTVYTWRKVYGAGEVTFKPNGSWDAKVSTIEFTDKKPGKYRFEVSMADTYGYTIVREIVDVTLNGKDGKLPANQAPKALPQTVNAIPGVPTAVTLTGTDPENEFLAFRISRFPSHGRLSGVPPNVIYTADFGYTGKDTFEFEVIDGQAVAAVALIDLNVELNPVKVTVYEGFDYPAGSLHGMSGDSSVGLDGTWSAGGSKGAYTIVNDSFISKNQPSTGAKLDSKGSRNAATRSINAEALVRDGLLKDGGELWFSAVIGRHDKINFRNSNLAFGIQDKADPKATDVAISWSTMSIHAAANGELGRSAVGWPGYKNVYPARTPILYVAHCEWAEAPEKPDTISVYVVIQDHRGQLIRLRKPVSTVSTRVDQSKLNTLYIKYNGGFIFDEIRVGPTYESAVLGTISTKATE